MSTYEYFTWARGNSFMGMWSLRVDKKTLTEARCVLAKPNEWVMWFLGRLEWTHDGGDLLKDVRVLHFSVVLGKFDRKDDAGDEEDQAPPQAEPEFILRSGGGEEVDIMQSKRKMIFTM